MEYIIGVDLGGTKIYSALFEDRKIIKILKFPTEANRGKTTVINNVVNSIKEIVGDFDLRKIKRIGIASPGPLNYKTGEIITTPNLPLRNFDLKGLLEKKFGKKVRVDNDAKCAGLAEAKARGAKNMVYITLGTGVGSALIYNGEIFRGNLYATEFGHMSINFNGPRCGCGRNGCLEAYCNSKALLRYAKERNIIESVYEIHKKAEEGKEKYKKIYGELGKYLGIGLANIVNSIDIDFIVIGGGLGSAGDLIIVPAVKEMRKNLLVKKNVKVEKAKLGEYASLIGAAELF